MYVVFSCQVQYDCPDEKPGKINGKNFMCSGRSRYSGLFENKRYLCSIYNKLKRSTQERKYEYVNINSSIAIAQAKL